LSEQGNAGMGSGAIATPDQDVDAYIPLSTARERYGDNVVQFATGTMLRNGWNCTRYWWRWIRSRTCIHGGRDKDDDVEYFTNARTTGSTCRWRC